MNKILQNIKNLGLLYAFITLFGGVPEQMYENMNYYIEFGYFILLAIVWYFFIKNISLFYEDQKIQKQNIVCILSLLVGYLGLMVCLETIDNTSFDGLYSFLFFIISIILLITGAIISIIIAYKLYKLTQIKAFLYYFVSILFIFIIPKLQNIPLFLSFQDYFDVAYYLIMSILFFKGVIEFDKQNPTHNLHVKPN